LARGDANLEGVEPPDKGQAVVSGQGANVLVTMGDLERAVLPACLVQDERGKESARINW
jgi:hypothetical protein